VVRGRRFECNSFRNSAGGGGKGGERVLARKGGGRGSLTTPDDWLHLAFSRRNRDCRTGHSGQEGTGEKVKTGTKREEEENVLVFRKKLSSFSARNKREKKKQLQRGTGRTPLIKILFSQCIFQCFYWASQ